MRFDFATAGRIVFGFGAAREIATIGRELGSRALLVTGRDPERHPQVLEPLHGACVSFTKMGEPTVDDVRAGAALAKSRGCDFIIGLGGGSAIDTGKAIAALATNSGEPLDYLEVIGRGKTLENPPLAYIAIPTTAGTGSEVTRNAVLGSREHRVKASMRDPRMLPRVAIIDPELTMGLPPAITASTGLDALTQLIEPFVSVKANPMTDMICMEGLPRVVRSLARACEDGSDKNARTDMCWASLLGGLALANSGLGIIHGFAAPIGGMFDAPHGAICAALLPHGMRVNIRALRERGPSERLNRYQRIASILTSNPDALPEDGAQWIADLCTRLRIPTLSSYGLSEADVEALVERASKASSTKGNPLPLTSSEMRDIIIWRKSHSQQP